MTRSLLTRSEGAQWFGDSLVVEHRYVADLVLAMQEEGMVVR